MFVTPVLYTYLRPNPVNALEGSTFPNLHQDTGNAETYQQLYSRQQKKRDMDRKPSAISDPEIGQNLDSLVGYRIKHLRPMEYPSLNKAA